MLTLVLKRCSVMLLGVVAASSLAIAQVSDVADTTPRITAVSKITTAEHQIITITGTGFGTMKPYTGDSNYISFYDEYRKWEAGYEPDGDTVTLIVLSWTNTKITLGGFSGAWGTSDYRQAVGNKEEIRVFNAQGPGGPFGISCPAGCAGKIVTVVAASTSTEISSSPNPSASGEPVTFTAVVTSADGVPPDEGKVVFMKGQETLGTGTLHGGVASFTTSALDFGENSIRAQYSGDADFEGTGHDEKSAVETHIVD